MSTIDLLRAAAKDTPPHTTPLPEIDAMDGDLVRIGDAAWEALLRANDPPRFFRRAGNIIRIEHDKHGAPVARDLTDRRLRHHMAREAEWYRMVKGPKATTAMRLPAHPPMAVMQDMLARPGPGLPTLDRIAEVPFFAADGRLIASPGFDEASSTLYAPAGQFTVPAVPPAPSDQDVKVARERLVGDFLHDFPFVGQADRAHALALLVTPFVRSLIAGPVPLLIVEKPTPGTGGTLLVQALGVVMTGRVVETLTEARGEEEWRKRLTAVLLGAPQLVFLDNIRSSLDSAALSAALTAEHWKDRILGRSEVATIPVRCAWVATGNNPAMSFEITRRAISCRLDAKVDRPWNRTGFRHAELLTWTREHRAELVWAVCVLVQRWIAADRPPGKEPLGTYEQWARVIGGILTTAGISGFLQNTTEFYARADEDGDTLRGFVKLWWDKHGGAAVGVADLVTEATTAGLDIEGKNDRSTRTRLGKILRSLRDRVFHPEGLPPLRVESAATYQGAAMWRLNPPRFAGGGRPGSPGSPGPEAAADRVDVVNVVNVDGPLTQTAEPDLFGARPSASAWPGSADGEVVL